MNFFVSINGEKLKNNNESEPNFHTIKLKNIPIKNEFQDLNFTIVNNIEISLSIKVKNIIGGGGFASRMNMFKKKSNTDTSGGIISTGAGVSIKDRLKFLKNAQIPQPSNEPKEKAPPKKLKIPSEVNNALMHGLGPIHNTNIPKKDNIEKEKKKVEENENNNKKEDNKENAADKILEENENKDNQKKDEKNVNLKEENEEEKKQKEEEQNIEEKKVEKEKQPEETKKENLEENKEEIQNNDKIEDNKVVKENEAQNEEKNDNKEEEKNENKVEEEKEENKEIEEQKENEEGNEENIKDKVEDTEKENKNEEEENIGEEKQNDEIENKGEEKAIEIEEKDDKIKEKENQGENEIEEEKKDIEQNKENEEAKHIEESENTELKENALEIKNEETQQTEGNKSKEEKENQELSENNKDKEEEEINKEVISEEKKDDNIEKEENENLENQDLINEENKEEKLKNFEEIKEEKNEEENDNKNEEQNEKDNEEKEEKEEKNEEDNGEKEIEEEKKEEENKEDNKEKEKKEEIKKENIKNKDNKSNTKRGSCVVPTGGFKNIFSNILKNQKTETNQEPKKEGPKKLDANKYKRLIGEKLIGQFIKKPNENELNKKTEQLQTTPKDTPIPLRNPSLEIPTTTPTPFKKEIGLLKAETLVESRGNFVLNKENEPRKNSSISPEQRNPKRNSVEANFGFEVLDSYFDDTNQNSAENESLIEEFLESMNYEDFLNNLKNQGIKEDPRESFCEGFFIASFPKKDGKVIENSAEKLPASCGHSECSKLPSMKPEIIMRYPLKDTKNLELNNLAATICFPTGIKLCYSENNYPQPIKDYVTQITNQKGERYYMRTFHFYHKIQNIDFTKEYEIHPLKHHLMKFGDEYTVLSEAQFTDDIVNNIQENLDFCQELGFRDIVYIPYCLCLISKYSYTKELETCLNTIYKIMSKNPNELNFEINELIMYLIHSIPIPIKNTRVRFYIPYNNSKLELLCPKVDDVSIMNISFTKLFDYLSIDNIVLVFRLLLSEKKVLFIHDDYTDLTTITDSFISLLYPFKWVHTYIPIMSDQMLKYLETFLPFLNGIHESLMKFVEDVFKEGELEDSDEVFLIYIKKDEIKLSSSLKKNKIKLSKYIQNNVLPLPFEKELKKELKNIESQKKSSKRESKLNGIDTELENRMRDAFIDIFVRMFHDYEKYIGILDDDVIFNKVLFMNSISKDEKFYDEFIDCQLFQQFTQNILKNNCSYFNKKITEFKERKKKDKKRDKKIRNSIESKENYVYLVKPDYLGVKENDKSVIESTINSYKIENETQEVKNRILGDVYQIDNDKYINSKCIIYLTPEKKETPKEDETKNKLMEIKGSNSSMAKKTTTLISGGELTEKQIEKIEDDIKDMVIKIFKSEIESDNKTLKTEAFRNLEISYGRTFFISLISNNNNNIISLQENSFGFLENLIYGILTSILKLEETEQVMEEVVILIKTTKFFQKEVKKEKSSKKKPESLFQSMKKKLQKYNKINQKNFWQKWFELSLKKLDEEEQKIDKVKHDLIIKTCQEMIELEISKSIIKNVCDNINKKIFGEGTENYVNAKQSYVKLVVQSQFISAAK